MRAILFTIAVATTTNAAAEPPGLTPAREAPRPKKRLLSAYALTVAGMSAPAMLAPLGGDHGPLAATTGMLACAGLVLGPSAGHWYAGERFTTGLGIRLAAAGVLGGMVIEDQRNRLGTGGLIVGGMTALALWEVGTAWDLITLPRAIRRANRKEVVVVPSGTGLAVAGRF